MIARTIGTPLWVLALFVVTTIASCVPEPVRCVPGASAACRCGESLGSTTCDAQGRYAVCVCSTTCREGTLLACRCEDGRVGLQRCLADGERSTCACDARCVEGETGRCSCGESLEGRVTCVDGVLGACDCWMATCVTDSTLECVCSGGALSVRRCVGGSFGACECSDAPVVPPPIDAGLTERCAPPASVPEPLEGLSPPGGWSHVVESLPVLVDARADGYVVVTRTQAVLLDRDGLERARYTSDLDIVAATLLDEGGVVIADRGRLRVLDDAFEVRASHLLAASCTAVVDVGCGRALCAEGGAVASYELASGARRESPLRVTGPLLRTYAEDLVIANGPLLRVLRDGSVVMRSPRFEAPTVPFGPGAGVVDRDRVVRDLTTCADPTIDGSAPCGEALGAVPFEGHGVAMDGDAAGYLYVVGFDVATSRHAIERYDVRTGTLVSRAVTSEVRERFPRMLAHDPWGERVLLAIDPCDGFSECMRVVTTAAYEGP